MFTTHASTHAQVSRMPTPLPVANFLHRSEQAEHTPSNPQSYTEVLTCEKGLKTK